MVGRLRQTKKALQVSTMKLIQVLVKHWADVAERCSIIVEAFD